MIEVTRFNGTPLTLNVDMILAIEQTPDTVISLTNGEKLVVRETVQELIDRVVAYKQRIHTYTTDGQALVQRHVTTEIPPHTMANLSTQGQAQLQSESS